MSLTKHAAHINSLRQQANGAIKISMVSGNFNVVHPGHLRLLKFAADCCDILIVAVHGDKEKKLLVSAALRLESIAAISCVDYSFIFNDDINVVIEAIRPELIVKGKEHQDLHNTELQALKKYGGKLLFSSGETVFSSIELIREESNFKASRLDLKIPHDYLDRHNIKRENIYKILEKFEKRNVLVIGDLIIDEYITCDVLGLSLEDPTVVVTPILEQKFIGGAGIVASHARGLGAKSTFLTVCGDDKEATDCLEKFREYDVEIKLANDASRPTTLKQRFKASGKTLLRVSHLKKHPIDHNAQNIIFKQFVSQSEALDLVIFSDFNYGVLPQRLVDRITACCLEKNIPIVADSQSSSQVGNISRFTNMLLLTPTEIEARIAIQDHNSGLINVIEALAKKCNPDYILLTLGAEGTLIQKQNLNKDSWVTDRLPALCTAPKDMAGAGDALFIASSLALICGATIWEAAYIGAVASGCQVSTVGNTPLNIGEIKHEISIL